MWKEKKTTQKNKHNTSTADTVVLYGFVFFYHVYVGSDHYITNH